MFVAKTLSFYKRPEVRKAILKHARHKEVAVRFGDYLGKRPDAFFQEGDILAVAQQKATSFHCSEELWTNPLLITTGAKNHDLSDLRQGWDLILDIDAPYWPLAKITAHLFVKALRLHNITAVTAKFSGNKGFHIAVPFESFPKTFQGKPTEELFPQAPRRIAHYLLDYLRRVFLEVKSDYFILDKRYKLRKEVLGDLLTPDNPLSIIEVDTILIAPRHLYRMPYSFHEKSQLISVPVRPDEILSFSKKNAAPNAVNFSVPFLDRDVAVTGEATELFVAAYDFEPQIKKGSDFSEKVFTLPEEAIGEVHFPPCMVRQLAGLKDGRKRALFTLINFLRGAGWGLDEIENRLLQWNQQNDEPLKEVVLKGRFRYERTRGNPLPPHNCRRYYQDMGVCAPDGLCARIKNPLQYAKIKVQTVTSSRPKLTDEQKAMRKAFRDQKKKQGSGNSSSG